MLGWVAVFAAVSAYDSYAILTGKAPTMSRYYKSSLERNRLLTMGVAVGLLAHLHEDDLKKLRTYVQVKREGGQHG